MALIKCPGCSKDISDKAIACPSCGYEMEKADQKESIKCIECGTILTKDTKACPNCGCPTKINYSKDTNLPQKVEVTKVELPKLSKNKKIILFLELV